MSTTSTNKPLGISEMISRIGDDKITLQRLGAGFFEARDGSRDCTIKFATPPGTALAMERGEVIGLVLWFKQSDYDAMLAARKEARDEH